MDPRLSPLQPGQLGPVKRYVGRGMKLRACIRRPEPASVASALTGRVKQLRLTPHRGFC